MGIVKAILKVLFAFVVPAIPVIFMWSLLGPETYWQTLTTMILGIVLYCFVGYLTVLIAYEW